MLRIKYLPSISVAAPLEVFSNITFAPIKASPVSASVTVPASLPWADWANNKLPKPSSYVRNMERVMYFLIHAPID